MKNEKVLTDMQKILTEVKNVLRKMRPDTPAIMGIMNYSMKTIGVITKELEEWGNQYKKCIGENGNGKYQL